jgi:hypothetical protein
MIGHSGESHYAQAHNAGLRRFHDWLHLIFLFALYWALMPTVLYLVGELVVRRTRKKGKTLGVNHF